MIDLLVGLILWVTLGALVIAALAGLGVVFMLWLASLRRWS